MEELAKRHAFPPNFVQADAVLGLEGLIESFEFECVGLPLVWVQGAVDVEQLIVWIELQLLALMKRKGLCEGRQKFPNIVL
jgi:hypothetical protein